MWIQKIHQNSHRPFVRKAYRLEVQFSCLQRYYNLPDWIIKNAYTAFIDIKKPDYNGFLDWIYYFAYKTKTFAFIAQTNDKKTLYEEELLEYAITNKDFICSNLYLQNSVVIFKDRKPSNKSALSTITNAHLYFPSYDMSVSFHWLLKTEEGIWLIHENSISKKTG